MTYAASKSSKDKALGKKKKKKSPGYSLVSNSFCLTSVSPKELR